MDEMVDLLFAADKLHLEVKGTHKLWALTSRLEIPIEHITGSHADPEPAMGWFQGLKIAGTDLPHVFRAGLFWQDGDKVFWDVRHPHKTIVIELEDEKFSKLIIEVKDPAAAVEEIRRALEDYRSAKDAAHRELEESLRGRPSEASTPNEAERLRQGQS